MTKLSRLTYSLGATLFCYGVVVFMFGPCLTAMADTFVVRLGALGLLFTFYSVGLIPSVLLNGYLSEVIGRRFILLAAVLAMGGGCALFAASTAIGPRPSFPLALAFVVLLGFGGGGVEVLTNVVIAADNQPKPAFALNVTHAFFAAGAVLGPLGASALLRADLPWQWAFFGASVPFAFLFALLWRQQLPAAVEAPFPPGAALGLLRSRLLWVLLAVISLYVGAEVGLCAWVSPFMERVLRSPRGAAGMSVSLFWAVMIVGRLAVGPLAVRFRPPPLLLVLSLGSAAAAIGVAFSHTIAGCLAATGIAGLFMSGVFGLALTDAARHFPERLGAVFGLMMAGVGLGSLVVPAAMGLAADVVGLRTAMLLPSGLMAVVAVIYVVRWSE